jgi:catechol 2,3-dioxygenase-like lactoylglutathione lyase family enzyme
MTIQRMEHVGIVVDDLAAATEFSAELGLVQQGEGSVEGRWVYRVVGLAGVDGNGGSMGGLVQGNEGTGDL